MTVGKHGHAGMFYQSPSSKHRRKFEEHEAQYSLSHTWYEWLPSTSGFHCSGVVLARTSEHCGIQSRLEHLCQISSFHMEMKATLNSITSTLQMRLCPDSFQVILPKKQPAVQIHYLPATDHVITRAPESCLAGTVENSPSHGK